jgi:hypothetical protein
MRSGKDRTVVHPWYTLFSGEYVGGFPGNFGISRTVCCQKTGFGFREEPGVWRNGTGHVALLVSHGEMKSVVRKCNELMLVAMRLQKLVKFSCDTNISWELLFLSSLPLPLCLPEMTTPAHAAAGHVHQPCSKDGMILLNIAYQR